MIHSNHPGELPPVPCRILEIHDEGTALVEVNGLFLELWTHDTARLGAIVAEHGCEASYQKHWRLLRVQHVTTTSGIRSAYCICVTPVADWARRPCPTEGRRYTTLAEQPRETGGFTIANPDLPQKTFKHEAEHSADNRRPVL